MHYRCACGEIQIQSVAPPPRCFGCDKCGSRLDFAHEFTYSQPEPHLYTKKLKQRGRRGWVDIPVCYWCDQAKWEHRAA
jgi:hypothetical protein